MVKVSIVVAIYNVEKYLTECVESLVSQTLDDIEIILVSDASPDNSVEIMEEYVQKYPAKIKSIVLPRNLRQGGARNVGYAIASGEYIGYVDGDDYVDHTMYEKLYTAAVSADYDVARCYYEQFDDENRNVISAVSESAGWCKIVKKGIVMENDIKFPEHTSYEDNYFWKLLDYYIKTEVVVKEYLYKYRQHSFSTTHLTSVRVMEERLELEERLLNNIASRGLETRPWSVKTEDRFLRIYCVNTIHHLIYYGVFIPKDFLKRIHNMLLKEFPDCIDTVKHTTEFGKKEKWIINSIVLSPSLSFLWLNVWALYKKLSNRK